MLKIKRIAKSVVIPGFFLIITQVLNALTPFDLSGQVAFATGKYRNLFSENGHSKKEIAQKINTAFSQLFHGDSAHSVYFEAGRNELGP